MVMQKILIPLQPAGLSAASERNLVMYNDGITDIASVFTIFRHPETEIRFKAPGIPTIGVSKTTYSEERFLLYSHIAPTGAVYKARAGLIEITKYQTYFVRPSYDTAVDSLVLLKKQAKDSFNHKQQLSVRKFLNSRLTSA